MGERHRHGFRGEGLSFPLHLATGGGFSTSSDAQKVEESIVVVLGTARGERLMRPDFGCGIHDLVFEPDTPSLRQALREHVLDALRRHEPRIDVLDVTIETAPDRQAELRIDVSYRLRRNNALHNMVYPFYLDEGGA